MDFETSQSRQFTQLLRDLAEKSAGRFDALDKQVQGAVREIARLRDDFQGVQSRYRERFNALAGHYHRGGDYKGPYRDAEQAKLAGRFFAAAFRRQVVDLDDFNRQQAAVDSSTGESGGALEADTLIAGIIRNVEQFGVLERYARFAEQPTQGAKIVVRTGGTAVSYPDYGEDADTSQPKFGLVRPELTVYQVYTPIDNDMLEDSLAIALADFVAQEMALSLAEATDKNAFVGDGTKTFARVLGLYNRAGGADVTADAEDDTFAEVIGASSTYLAKVPGAFLHSADDGELRWYLHRSVLFAYWGLKDTQNRPLLDLFRGADDRPQLMLGQYPVVITQAAPALSASAANTPMALMANLRRGTVLARHTRGIQFRQSEHVLFSKRQTALAMDVRQDIVNVDKNMHGRLISGAGN